MDRSEWRLNFAIELARDIRGDGATTCCCHITVDDDNVDDENVAWCVQTAARKGHTQCLHLALLLASFSFTRRKKLARQAWDL